MRTHLPLCLTALALAAGCGGYSSGGRHEIEIRRTLDEPRRGSDTPVDSATRFGYRRTDRGGDATAGSDIGYDVPRGWEELPPAQFRNPNFRIPGRDALECYVTVLPGGGGDVAMNVNRWRGQMGLEPISEAEVAALPRKTLMGREGVAVELEGTYGGMSESPRTGYKMVGVLVQLPMVGITVKMVGPAADVDAEKAGLESLCASIRLSAGGGMPPGHGSTGGGGAESGAMTWTVPEGWTVGGGGQFRLVTLHPGGNAEVECYVTVLTGDGGGVTANLNRWQSQLGLEPLSDAEVEALPTVDVLGVASPLLAAKGDFKGMGGTERDAAGLIAIVCPLGSHTLFVKMTGPVEGVFAARDGFEAFVRSIRQ